MKTFHKIPFPKPRNKGITKRLKESSAGDSWLIDSSTVGSWLAIAFNKKIKITVRQSENNKGKHRVWRLPE